MRMMKELHHFYHERYKCSSSTNRLALSPNGRYAVVGSHNGNVIVYDVLANDFENIYEHAHKTAVVACEWQPRGSKFASIDNLGSLFLWN
jgi:WD40 repeat protein